MSKFRNAAVTNINQYLKQIDSRSKGLSVVQGKMADQLMSLAAASGRLRKAALAANQSALAAKAQCAAFKAGRLAKTMRLANAEVSTKMIAPSSIRSSDVRIARPAQSGTPRSRWEPRTESPVGKSKGGPSGRKKGPVHIVDPSATVRLVSKLRTARRDLASVHSVISGLGAH